jgi:hypothetical protein
LGKESFDVASLFSSNVISRYTVTNRGTSQWPSATGTH